MELQWMRLNATSYVDTLAAMRLFGESWAFQFMRRYPTVMPLSVHLENGQRVYFTEDNLHDRVNEPPKTTLTAFFLLCQQDNFAKTLLYCEVTKYYTWEASRKVFKRRIIGAAALGNDDVRTTGALGRVYTVHSNNFECFFLRLLLHTVKGPTSFEDLRTVNSQVCATYRDACELRGLLEDDAHWDATMLEAAAVHSATSLRNFVWILSVDPSDRSDRCFANNDPKRLIFWFCVNPPPVLEDPPPY